MRTLVDANSSRVKMADYVKATQEDSVAFVRSRAKMDACMVERTVQFPFRAVTKASVRMEEYVLPRFRTTNTPTRASAFQVTPGQNVRPPPHSHLSRGDICISTPSNWTQNLLLM